MRLYGLLTLSCIIALNSNIIFATIEGSELTVDPLVSSDLTDHSVSFSSSGSSVVSSSFAPSITSTLSGPPSNAFHKDVNVAGASISSSSSLKTNADKGADECSTIRQRPSWDKPHSNEACPAVASSWRVPSRSKSRVPLSHNPGTAELSPDARNYWTPQLFRGESRSSGADTRTSSWPNSRTAGSSSMGANLWNPPSSRTSSWPNSRTARSSSMGANLWNPPSSRKPPPSWDDTHLGSWPNSRTRTDESLTMGTGRWGPSSLRKITHPWARKNYSFLPNSNIAESPSLGKGRWKPSSLPYPLFSTGTPPRNGMRFSFSRPSKSRPAESSMRRGQWKPFSWRRPPSWVGMRSPSWPNSRTEESLTMGTRRRWRPTLWRETPNVRSPSWPSSRTRGSPPFEKSVWEPKEPPYGESRPFSRSRWELPYRSRNPSSFWSYSPYKRASLNSRGRFRPIIVRRPNSRGRFRSIVRPGTEGPFTARTNRNSRGRFSSWRKPRSFFWGYPPYQSAGLNSRGRFRPIVVRRLNSRGRLPSKVEPDTEGLFSSRTSPNNGGRFSPWTRSSIRGMPPSRGSPTNKEPISAGPRSRIRRLPTTFVKPQDHDDTFKITNSRA